MGQFMLHVDAREKVTGEAKFAGDIQLPGMLCARILRPPSHFSELTGVDTSEAEKMEGVAEVFLNVCPGDILKPVNCNIGKAANVITVADNHQTAVDISRKAMDAIKIEVEPTELADVEDTLPLEYLKSSEAIA